jgi:hypothetical protein
MSYYQLQRISNSDLTIAEHLLNGIPYTRPEVAFRLGTAFHELVLEPEKFRAESCRELDFKLLYRMYRTVVANRFCQTALHATEKEKVILWQEPITGIACKCKLDMIWLQGQQAQKVPVVLDFKTTSAGSLAAFLQACRQYNYDRQMAFYADSIGARQGRQKYRQLLQRIQELDMFEDIYYARNNGSYPVAGQAAPKSLEESLLTYG